MAGEAVPGAVERVVSRYLELRNDRSERFIDVYERLGAEPFEEALNGA
jgi:sulfite reductase (NADPH) hemoprotein beta-component